MNKIILLGIILVLPVLGWSATINVPADQPTIQNAIDHAKHNDTVLVDDGTYYENIVFREFDIKVLSKFGPNTTTIIPVYPDDPVVKINTPLSREALFSGFTISGAATGKAFYIELGSPTVSNNIFTGNMLNATKGTVFYCCNLAKPLVHHNIFYNNEGTFSVFLHSPAVFNNNVIYAAPVTGLYIIPADAVTFNNIIVNCKTGIHRLFEDREIYSDYNLLFGNQTDYINLEPAPNDISADPLFANINQFDLLPESPCINAGFPEAGYNDPDGTRGDIGAKFHPQLSIGGYNLRVSPSVLDTFLVTPDVIISWDFYSKSNSEQSGYQIQIGTDDDWSVAEVWDSDTVMLSDTMIIFDGYMLSDREKYWIRIRVFSDSSWSPWISEYFITRYDRQLFVPSQFATIQSGIDNAIPGDTVVIENGRYYENNINMKSQICLRGESNNPDNVIIDCDTTGRAFNFETVNSSGRIERVKIVKGNALETLPYQFRGGAVLAVSSDIVFDSCYFAENNGLICGGAIYLYDSKLTATDCLFEDNNTMLSGGAISAYHYQSAIELNRCVFNNNIGNSGSGVIDIAVGKYLIVDDCSFTNNTGGTDGGAIHCYRIYSASITNSVFSENHCSEYGGAINSFDAQLDIKNVTFNKNTAGWNGGSIYVDSTILKAERCSFDSCSSGGNGGSIFIGHSESSTIDEATFNNSSSGSNGGAIAVTKSSSIINNCSFMDNYSKMGGAVFIESSDAHIFWSSFIKNSAHYGGALAGVVWNGNFNNNTVALCSASRIAGGLFLQSGSALTISNSIISYSSEGTSLFCGLNSTADISCSDIFGNSGGDWIDCISDQRDINSNLQTNPLFCDSENDNFHLVLNSPCAPGNNCTGLIGAFDIGCIPTGVEDLQELPDSFILNQNFPNPFNPSTKIEFSIPKISDVKLNIYNINGQLVKTLVNRNIGAGFYTIFWDASQYSSGVYFYRLEADEFVETKKMVLIK